MSATATDVGLWHTMQAEHDRIWELLNAITGGPGTGNEQPSAGEQRRLAKQLVRYASAHELTEDLVIWPAVARCCEDGDQLVARGLEQERTLRRALNELNSISAGNQEFAECVNTIASDLRNHLSYEQNQVWPRLADELSSDYARRLEQRWRRLRALVPSRPHPHLSNPVVLGGVARLAARL